MSLLCVQWKTPDDGKRNCPKHVELHPKNKFEKLVHLVGFIIRNLSRCMVTWTSIKNVQTVWGFHPTSHPKVNGNSFPAAKLQKQSWLEANQSSPSRGVKVCIILHSTKQDYIKNYIFFSRLYRLSSFENSSWSSATGCPTSEVRLSAIFLLAIVEN